MAASIGGSRGHATATNTSLLPTRVAHAGQVAQMSREAEYSRMLHQLAQLQTQLQANLHAQHMLKSQNASLQDSNDQMKKDLVRQRRQADDCRRRWNEATKAKLEVEKRYKALMEDWDAQLEAKAEEFEELKAKLAPPRDLDVLKAKIKEGIEAEWSDKVEMIAADRDRFKNMMHNVRREHESLKTEFQEATANWSQESEIAQERHNAVILHLRQQVEDLQRIVDDPTPQDTIRVLQTKLESTKVLEDNLKRELSDLRQAKEDAVVARDQAILAHKSDKSAMLTTIRTLKADISSFQRQRETAELNAQKLNNTASESARRVEHLEKDVARLKRQLSTQERHVAGADTVARERIGEAASAWDAERSDMQSKIETLEEANDKLQTQVRKLQDERKHAELRRNESVRHVTTELQAKLADAEDRYRDLVTQNGQEEGARAAQQREHRDQVQRLQARIEAIQQDRRKAEQEKTAAETKMRQALDEIATLQSEQAETRASHEDLEEEYKALQGKHREHLAREHALAIKTQRLEMTVQHLEGEVESLQADMEQQRVAHEAAIQEQMMLRQKLATADQATQESTEKTLKKTKHDLGKLVAKHKKRADEYKRRLLETYGRWRRASESLKAYKNERSSTIQDLESRLAAQKRRVKELERNREMWLRGGGFNLGGAGAGLGGMAPSVVGTAGAPARPVATASGDA